MHVSLNIPFFSVWTDCDRISISGLLISKELHLRVESIFLKLGKRIIECTLSPDPICGQSKIVFQTQFITKSGFKHLKLIIKHANNEEVIVTSRLLWVRKSGISKKIKIPSKSSKIEEGINIVGLFRYELGIGEGARLNALALKTTDIPHSLIEAPFFANCNAENTTFENQYVHNLNRKINLFHFNAPEMKKVYEVWPRVFKNGQYNIGYWAWELARLPETWKLYFEGLQEIWVPSTFVKNSIEPVSPIPVYVIPHPVSPIQNIPLKRSDFGLPEGKFILLSTFDLNSYITRKNPQAVIEAFKIASSENSNLHLVLKINNAKNHPRELQVLYD